MPWRENKGVCQFKRNLYGCFLVAYGKMFWSSEDRVRARFHYAESRQNKPLVNLLGKSLLKYGL